MISRSLEFVGRPKRVRASAGGTAWLVGSFAAAAGMELLSEEEPDEVDLSIVDVDSPEDVRVRLRSMTGPLLAVACRRLNEATARAILEAGAARIIDTDANLLDAGIAFSELLFRSFTEQRRYSRCHGGLPVRFRPPFNSHVLERGVLLGFARSGGYISTPQRVDEGTRLVLEIEVLGRPAVLRGRVAYAGADGFGLEFALDEHEVAPKLQALRGGVLDDSAVA